jgi:hypothetical protein
VSSFTSLTGNPCRCAVGLMTRAELDKRYEGHEQIGGTQIVRVRNSSLARTRRISRSGAPEPDRLVELIAEDLR